jgi:ParB family chromosome partitioning protein
MEAIHNVDIEKIQLNPFQPRRHFSHEELNELAASISSVGLIHPPTVRLLEDGSSYELLSGERRLRASKQAGLKKIPVYVRKSTNSHSAQAALIENLQRVDLNPMEIAQALTRLMFDFKYTQEDLANRIGKKRSTVANYLRLLSLPKEIQESVTSGAITMGHAKAILSLEGLEHQLELHGMILRNGCSVRQAEAIALRMNVKKGKKPVKLNGDVIFLKEMEEKMQEALGTKVTIEDGGKKGRIVIDYYTLDDLDSIFDKLTRP